MVLLLAGGQNQNLKKEGAMKFHIVSDSSCDLGRERAAALGVDLVSYYAALGDEVYLREEKDLSTHDFYQRMADNPGVFPRTSMPTVEDYLQAFRPAVSREKIWAARCPRAGEKRFCMVRLACSSASMAMAMASSSVAKPFA